MFFNVGKEERPNFSHNHRSKSLVVSLDEGWQHTLDQDTNDIWFKGYMDDGDLSEHAVAISQESDPLHHGNFCVIKVFDRGAVIRGNRWRSFPIYLDPRVGINNLERTETTFWCDDVITIDNDLNVINEKVDVIGDIQTDTIRFDDAVDVIDDILSAKIKRFLDRQTTPIRVFLSGGIDTTCLFSYIKRFTDNYEMVPYSHCDFDYFYMNNHSSLGKFWGYNQIHHWREDCVLASGAPGDEFTLRGPSTINLMLRHYGTSVPELLKDEKFANSLHNAYFDQEKNFNLWESQTAPSSLEDLIRHCCNMNLNDWQHWHLGRTLTYTPFRDLDIYKTVCRMKPEDIKEQAMNSTIQMVLMRRNSPEVLDYLSEKKNVGNSFSNLSKLYK